MGFKKNIFKKHNPIIVKRILSYSHPTIDDYHDNIYYEQTKPLEKIAVEVEFVGKSDSKIPYFFLNNNGLFERAEYDGSVSVEYPTLPIPNNEKSYKLISKTIDKILSTSNKYFGNEVYMDVRCGTHINISFKNARIYDYGMTKIGKALLDIINEIQNKKEDLLSKIYGRGFNNYATKVDIYDLSRYNWINLEKVNNHGVIEFRLAKFINKKQFFYAMKLSDYIAKRLLTVVNKVEKGWWNNYRKQQIINRICRYINKIYLKLNDMEVK